MAPPPSPFLWPLNYSPWQIEPAIAMTQNLEALGASITFLLKISDFRSVFMVVIKISKLQFNCRLQW